MKRVILALLLPIVALFVFAVATANAQTFRSGDTTSVAATETIDGSAFIAGSTVDVAGTIKGDLYCAGQTVTITGRVEGDVLCAGQTITLAGMVTGDARIAGQTISLTGDIEGSLSAAGQTATLGGTSKVGRDALFLGQSVTVVGPVERDLTIASGSTVINAKVGRNLAAEVETLTLGANADVKGSVDYIAPTNLSRSHGANVDGKITYTERKVERRADVAAGFNLAGAIMWWLMLVVSALIFALLFPRELHRTTEPSVGSFPQVLLAVAVGLIAGIVMPIAILLLMATVFALPFALVLLVAWVLILAVSGAFAAYYLGRVIWRTQTNAILTTLIGAAVIATALAVPVLNVLAWFLVVWYGSGAVLIQLKRMAAVPHYDMAVKKTRGRSK